MSHRSKTRANHKDCSPSRVARYQGKRHPRCNGGLGCRPCWDKYDAARRNRSLAQTVIEDGFAIVRV
jgi:hypothetical protein